VIGSDQGVHHTKTPDSATNWIFTTPAVGPRTFRAFTEVKGQMISVGFDGKTGPIAVDRPANPQVWLPIAREPPATISLVGIASNYSVGATYAGTQVAVGSVMSNGTQQGLILMSSNSGADWNLVAVDNQPGGLFSAVVYMSYCYANGASQQTWIAVGTMVVLSNDAVNWRPATTLPRPLSSTDYATSVSPALHASQYGLVLGGTNGLLAYSTDCGDTWTASTIN